MLPRCYSRWLFSFALGAILLGYLLWESQQTHKLRAVAPVRGEAETPQLEPDSQQQPLTLRNPDRWESHESSQQLRILRQCMDSHENLSVCLSHANNGTPSLSRLLEALRYQERQPGHAGDPSQMLEQLGRMLPDTRDQLEVYQIWFHHYRHPSDNPHRGRQQLSALKPKYLSLVLQAGIAARQGHREESLAFYEASVDAFLEAMLDRMRSNQAIGMETYNQNQDLKDLARFYLQTGWWIEAERVLYRLAEQEPADQIVLGLMEQLRQQRSTQGRAG